ncbi:hypothetical protein GALMADRAFT_218490 [Galerina marginata CBS 339.88]|uniref:Uncharacterized protein n=1 Tax=Galerina marginata (strain CBS 339.88) TaxID=685588 RepID=A0A067TQE3_GALM3|nr:hypothetical protein GALMADRAFT_218490 [Galerina marginata CBS 339.88]
MATRRRIGVSAATTEAARRQLMQPVPCWEKVWITPSGVTTGSSGLKVYKWAKTEKIQQFSDDEGEVDEPLAPLPDEPEVVEGDEDLEQEEPRIDSTQVKDLEVVDMDINQDDPPSKMPSPKPQLMMQSSAEDEAQDPSEGLDASLKPLDTSMNGDEIGKEVEVEGLELDISGLGPDGLQLENAHDLSQLDGEDALIGGPLMDASVDPFSDTT